MNVLTEKFRSELLAARMDISLSDVYQDASILKVSGKVGMVRLMLGGIFFLPAFIAILSALSSKSLILIILALCIVPLLFLAGSLFAFLIPEKSFDRSRRIAVNALSLFGRKTTEEMVLSSNGVVRLSKRRHSGGMDSGDCWFYDVAVAGCQGMSFTIARDCAAARHFAGQLAGFMAYSLIDEVGVDNV